MKTFTNIEDLKKQWLKQATNSLKAPLTYSEIETIVRKKSTHELGKLKRNFIIESAFSIPLLIIATIIVNHYAISYEALLFNIITSIVILIFCIPFIKVISIWSINNESIASYLNRAVPLMLQLNQAVQTISIIIMPFSFACGFVIGIMHGSTKTSLAEIFTPMAIFIGFIAMICTCLLGYFGMIYYYKVVYKKHINKLKILRNEINKAELNETVDS